MAKVNGMAFTQWDGTIYWDKVGVLSKMDPRQDPELSLNKWIHSPRMINPYLEYPKPCEESRKGS